MVVVNRRIWYAEGGKTAVNPDDEPNDEKEKQ